jgi:hypothetical protein
MFSRAAAVVPLKDRLRSVRIESASMPRNRILALDGSDLVYRMCLPAQDGYFGDDDIERMLAGVLAGLPENVDVRLALGTEVTNTEMKYESHTLELALDFYEGDKPGYYEYEIAQFVGDALL